MPTDERLRELYEQVAGVPRKAQTETMMQVLRVVTKEATAEERERCAWEVHSAARPFVDGLKEKYPLEAGAAWAVCDDIAAAIRARDKEPMP